MPIEPRGSAAHQDMVRQRLGELNEELRQYQDGMKQGGPQDQKLIEQNMERIKAEMKVTENELRSMELGNKPNKYPLEEA